MRTVSKPTVRKQVDRYDWIDAVSDIYSPLTPMERLAARVLAEHRNHETGRCDPSLRRIAQRMGCSVMTAHRAIKALEKHRFLKVEKRAKSNSTYELVLPHLYSPVEPICIRGEYITTKNHPRTGERVKDARARGAKARAANEPAWEARPPTVAASEYGGGAYRDDR